MRSPFIPRTTRFRRHERRPHEERGQALVEFALVLPLLLFIVLGIIDLGKAFGYKNDETNLANEAARAAAVNQCPGGCLNISDWIISQAPSELKKGKVGGSIHTGLDDARAIIFTFPAGSTKHCIGDPVKVTVKVDYNWLNFLTVGGVFPSIGTDITGSATMRLEHSYMNDSSIDKYTASGTISGTCTS